MRFRAGLATRLGTSGELLRYFARLRWWWLMPMIVALLILSAIIVFAELSGIAPFIYTLF